MGKRQGQCLSGGGADRGDKWLLDERMRDATKNGGEELIPRKWRKIATAIADAPPQYV